METSKSSVMTLKLSVQVNNPSVMILKNLDSPSTDPNERADKLEFLGNISAEVTLGSYY